MVWLHIEDEFGCRDSIAHEVLVLGSLDFPNIFTPIGSDGSKYVFRPLEDQSYYEEFTIEIFDRWGVSVWSKQCKSPNCPDYDDAFWWDGTNKWGKQVSDGVYYWVVYARYYSTDIKPLVKNGSVTVISK
jgi:flagellar hook assembly protein FlgD